MRVLQLVKGLDLGGAERVVTDLATHLAAGGIEVEVAVINGSRRALLPTLQQAGIAVHALPGSDHIGLRGFLAVRRVLRTGNYDLVHTHGPLPLVIARLAGARAPLVGTIHSMWHALRRPSRTAAALLCGDARIVAVSAAARDALPARMRRHATVIPHGVDLTAVRSAVDRAHVTDRDHVELLTVASHRREKNYDNLLQAVAEAHANGAAIRLRAIGEGPQLAQHQERATVLGIDKIVSFEPPRADVLRDIASTDVFVLSSDSEGQPIVLVEALATGRPVIATTVGRAPELVTPDVGLLVAPGDSHAMAQAICTLAADPERRAAMGRAALATAQRHSLDGDVAVHLALYTELCATTGAT